MSGTLQYILGFLKTFSGLKCDPGTVCPNWSGKTVKLNKCISFFRCSEDDIATSLFKFIVNLKARLTLEQLSMLPGLQCPQISWNCSLQGQSWEHFPEIAVLQLLKVLVHNLFVYGVICSLIYETEPAQRQQWGRWIVWYNYRERVYNILCHDILCSQFTGTQYQVATLNCDQKYI